MCLLILVVIIVRKNKNDDDLRAAEGAIGRGGITATNPAYDKRPAAAQRPANRPPLAAAGAGNGEGEYASSPIRK